MTIDPNEAATSLQDIATVEADARGDLLRRSSVIFVIWGSSLPAATASPTSIRGRRDHWPAARGGLRGDRLHRCDAPARLPTGNERLAGLIWALLRARRLWRRLVLPARAGRSATVDVFLPAHALSARRQVPRRAVARDVSFCVLGVVGIAFTPSATANRAVAAM